MPSSETSIQQLAEAARSIQEKATTVEMLDEAVVFATEIIEGCDLAGMSIVNPPASTPPPAAVQR